MNMFTVDACILLTIWFGGIFEPIFGVFEVLIPAIAVYAIVLRLMQLSLRKVQKRSVMR